MKIDKIIYLIGRIREKANRYITDELTSRGIVGLAPSHGDILFALLKNGNLHMKELAQIIDRKKTTITTLIEKLVKLGYVEKTVDENDKRYYVVSLTKKGRSLKSDLIDISHNLITKTYKGIPPNEREMLVRVLSKINENW
ncbi:MAG: MarR family transcriptional regulator [Proteobacteria bacterium]|nr:MarR family transcriptional regulator [Pseudomonadota bacterium]